jgi:hypothetical protein
MATELVKPALCKEITSTCHSQTIIKSFLAIDLFASKSPYKIADLS